MNLGVPCIESFQEIKRFWMKFNGTNFGRVYGRILRTFGVDGPVRPRTWASRICMFGRIWKLRWKKHGTGSPIHRKSLDSSMHFPIDSIPNFLSCSLHSVTTPTDHSSSWILRTILNRPNFISLVSESSPPPSPQAGLFCILVVLPDRQSETLERDCVQEKVAFCGSRPTADDVREKTRMM